VTRAAVVAAAAADVGPDTHEKRIRIWTSALGRPVTYAEIEKLAWCGGAALCWLHDAGLALDVHWAIGNGFLLQKPHPLPIVKLPQPGDIGYQASPFQHHFVVESVEDGHIVHSVDGNQPDVRRRSRMVGPNLTFFSIRPYLELVSAPDELPSPAVQLPRHATSAEYQHAINSLMLVHPLEHTFGLLLVDGIVGPKTTEALRWAQKMLKVPVTGFPDAATAAALGLS
jgi:hypothetical protein